MSVVRDFVGDGLVLIVDPSANFSATLQICFRDFGIPFNQIKMVKKFEDAKKFILEYQPKVVVTEYDIQGQFGLALLELQEKFHNELARLAIIATQNNSDAAVAEAAEEEVDLFILKPFSVELFKHKLTAAVQAKLLPSPYYVTIKSGKKLLQDGQREDAVQAFLRAKTLTARPSLANFYLGKAYESEGKPDGALSEYREGRKIQPLHYRCLTAEFDFLTQEKKYKEAFPLVELIASNYPVTAERLGKMFAAAVLSYRFDLLKSYYSLFLKLESRPQEITRIVSMAMLTAGHFLLQKKDIGNALWFFETGSTVAGREIKYMESVIHELLQVNLAKEAKAFFIQISTTFVGSNIHKQLAFRINQHLLPPDQVMEMGRRLVLEGAGDPEIFKTVVRLLGQAQKTTLAETVIAIAVKDHPEMNSELYKILEISSAKKEAN